MESFQPLPPQAGPQRPLVHKEFKGSQRPPLCEGFKEPQELPLCEGFEMTPNLCLPMHQPSVHCIVLCTRGFQRGTTSSLIGIWGSSKLFFIPGQLMLFVSCTESKLSMHFFFQFMATASSDFIVFLFSLMNSSHNHLALATFRYCPKQMTN